MTVDEVAEYLRLDRSTIYRLIAEGSLHSFRIGRVWRFFRKDVEDLGRR